MTRTFFLLFGFSLIAGGGPAAAAPAINDAGAAGLKTQIQTLLDRQKSARKLAGGELVTQGEILIEQADNYYAVTLPDITVKDAAGAKHPCGYPGHQCHAGQCARQLESITVHPHADYYQGCCGNRSSKVDIGTQQFSGHGMIRWQPSRP